MKILGLKKLAMRGLKNYYVTACLVVVLFFCVTFTYKSGFDLFGVQLESSLRVLMTLIFMTFASLLIHEKVEEHKCKRLRAHPDDALNANHRGRILLFVCNGISAAFFYTYFYLLDVDTIPEYVILGRIILMGYTLFMLFLSVGRTDSRGFGRHLWNSMSTIAAAGFFSLILFFGLSFLALMINLLFEADGLNIYINDFVFLGIFSFVLVFPLLFLSIYSDQKQMELITESEQNTSKLNPEMNFINRISLFYIVMPLLIAYTVVLYIYFFKQAFLLEFPNNVLAHLVVWYLFVSHIALYFISGISRYKNEFEKWIILNSRKLIPALVVPVLLLFTSIFIRIYHYGFTESRYFLLLFALFNTLGLLLLFVYKWRAQFAIVVLSIVMLHISMYGSLSARNVTYHSQMNILVEIFKEQGHDLEQILGGGATCAGVILESEVAYRVDSCIDKIMAQKISDFEGREYAALKDLQSSCGAMLSTKYYSNSVREKSVYTNLSAYNYDGIVHLADHEYMFRIRDMEEIEVGDFVVSGNPSGIAIFDKNDYNRRSETGNGDEQSLPGLCYFDFLTNVIEDNAEVPVYQMYFAFDNREFEVFFILEDFNFNVDEEKNIVEDSYNYYTIYCVLRERR